MVFQNKRIRTKLLLPKTPIQPRFEDAVIYILKKRAAVFQIKFPFKALLKVRRKILTEVLNVDVKKVSKKKKNDGEFTIEG